MAHPTANPVKEPAIEKNSNRVAAMASRPLNKLPISKQTPTAAPANSAYKLSTSKKLLLDSTNDVAITTAIHPNPQTKCI
jgi:hypothetical protein